MIEIPFALRDDVVSRLSERSGLPIAGDVNRFLEQFHSDDLRAVLAEVAGAPLIDVPADFASRELAQHFDAAKIHQLGFVPLDVEGGAVSALKPWDFEVRDAVSRLPFDSVQFLTASEGSLRALERHLGTAAAGMQQLTDEIAGNADTRQRTIVSLDAMSASDNPLHKLMATVLQQALTDRATEIHLAPRTMSDGMDVLFEVEGRVKTTPFFIQEASREVVENYIYQLAADSRMEAQRRHQAQNGSFQLLTQGETLEVRVACLPASRLGYPRSTHLTLRLQDRRRIKDLSLHALGFDKMQERIIRASVGRPGALNVIAGPVGSGKSTTLYQILRAVRRPDQTLYTTEDPIEFFEPGWNQFAYQNEEQLVETLKTFLRKKPHLVLVSEIRSAEVAEAVLNLPKTGCRTYTTLHVNSAVDIPERLIGLKVDPVSLASCLSLMSSQRLVPLLCPRCSVVRPATEDDLLRSGLPLTYGNRSLRWRHPAGCSECQQGYRARRLLIEVVPVDLEMRRMIRQRRSPDEMREHAERKFGVRWLKDQAEDLLRHHEIDPESFYEVAEFSWDELLPIRPSPPAPPAAANGLVSAASASIT